MTRTKEPCLSVIIVNRDTADLLENCLQSVFGSDLEAEPEVIVVDNGSRDDSVLRVRRRFPEAKIIEAGRNLGFAAANNRAVEIATGLYLFLVNTDVTLKSDCARNLLALMEEDSEIGMAGPQLLNRDGSPQTSYEAAPTLASEILNRSLLKRLFPNRYPGKGRAFERPTEVETLIGAAMMISREAFDLTGGFDEDYFFFLEETDLAIRMRKSGFKVVTHPGAEAPHLQGGTAKRYRAGARIEFYRSRYTFFGKHYGLIAEKTLRFAIMLNLTISVAALGSANLVTLGLIDSLAADFGVKLALWTWHMQGRPDSRGLPRD